MLKNLQLELGTGCLNCMYAFEYCVCELTGSLGSVYHAHQNERAKACHSMQRDSSWSSTCCVITEMGIARPAGDPLNFRCPCRIIV